MTKPKLVQRGNAVTGNWQLPKMEKSLRKWLKKHRRTEKARFSEYSNVRPRSFSRLTREQRISAAKALAHENRMAVIEFWQNLTK